MNVFSKSFSKIFPVAVHFLPFLFLILGLWLTFHLSMTAYNRAVEELHQTFTFQALEIEHKIQERLKAYSQVLYGTRGMFRASNEVSRAEFHNYVKNLDLKNFYPGIQGVGYTVVVPKEEKQQHIEKIRSQGFPEYHIYPEGERELFYTSVIYLEPFSKRNLRAFGYDMYFEKTRRIALNKSRDTNSLAISGKVILVQETDEDIQSGFLMYLPLYKKNADISTIKLRQAHLIAWVYAVFRMDDLMQGLFGENAKNLHLSIYDGKKASVDNLMHDNHKGQHLNGRRLFSFSKNIDLGSHFWHLEIHSLPEFEKLLDLNSSHIIVFTGSIGSIMLCLIVLLLTTGHQRALATAQNMNLAAIEREKRYRQMFEGSGSVSFLLNPNTGDIIDANPAASKFWGYDVEELRNMNIFQISPNPPENILPIFAKAMKEPQRFQTQHRLKNENIVDVEVYASSILYEKRQVLYAIAHDISARIRSEKDLQESKARWRFALEGSSDGIWDWNIQTGKVFLSKPLTQMLGFKEQEFRESLSTWQQRIHPEDRALVEMTLNEYFMGKRKIYSCEHRIRCKDGTWKWILDRGIIVNRDDLELPLRMIGTHTDISLQKETEETLKEAKQAAIVASQAKSEFLANMSHEIRTPMNAILGFSSILSDLINNPVQKHYLNAIQTSGKTLLQLINDILDLSKIEAGKLQLNYKSVALEPLLNDVATIFSPKMAKHKQELTLRIHIQENVPKYLLLDEIRLRQILLNLVGNAVKFTEKGYIHISAKIEPLLNYEKDNLIISVSDTGIGIAKEQQQEIFSAFSQSHGQNIVYGGTGLGLTICKRLLELMEGEINLESQKGEGSRFIISLPTYEVAASPVKETTTDISNIEFLPAKILVVDDELLNRQLVEAYLESFSHLTLLEAETGQQAIDLSLEHHPNLILMDKRLPDMDGNDVCKEIKIIPQCENVPIIMITASVMGFSPQNSNYDIQLNKPINKTELLIAMKSFLPTKNKKQQKTVPEQINFNAIKTQNINESEKLLVELEKIYQEHIDEINPEGILDIDSLIETSESLERLAKQYNYTALRLWANKLKKQAELFDLENLPETLKEFSNLIDALKTT